MRTLSFLVLVIVLASTATAQPPMPEGLKKLQGFWKAESIQYDGKEQIPDAKQRGLLTLVVKDAEYRMYCLSDAAKDEHYRLFTADLKLDPATKTFELNVKDGQKKGERRHGVYEVTDKNLKLCYGPIDKPRPTKFEATKDSEHFLEVWTPEKK